MALPKETPVYDFSPFLTCPAVTAVARTRSDQINLIAIPSTQIPSPLAPNIAPQTLVDLKESLVGKPGTLNPSGGVTGIAKSGKGFELWESWKRAWDLWNNHYIEGREDPEWIGQEYEKVKKELEKGENGYGNDDKTSGDGEDAELAARAAPRTMVVRTEKDLPPPSYGRVWKDAYIFTIRQVLTGNKVKVKTGNKIKIPAPGDGGTEVEVDEEREEDEVAERFIEYEWNEIDDPNFVPKTPPPPRKESDNGKVQNPQSSGGFFAIKDFPEYQELDDDSNNLLLNDDIIQNSVWRPRRVGESALQIDLDQSLDEFYVNSELQVDGGVDCGRSPYPLLRSKIVYREWQHNYSKNKIWDGVTGTVFNIPTKSIENEGEATDPRILRTKQKFGAALLNKRYPWENPDIFPLDIRRVRKVNRKLGKPISSTNDVPAVNLIQAPPEFELTDLRSMEESDPWWVTEEQGEYQDRPPRRYPTKHSEQSTELLPIDSTHWKEHVHFDEDFEARYFVTNLHGGNLVINGIVVEKGCVAGPLPPFAVIETEGGQVSFWWGVGGRDWGAGPVSLARRSQIYWDALRRTPGWEDIGVLAGDVWARKIADRIEREGPGENLFDDEQWEAWKKAGRAVVAETESAPPDATNMTFWDRIAAGVVTEIETPEEELKWVMAQDRIYLECQGGDVLSHPDDDAFWDGARPRADTYTASAVKHVEADWAANRDVHIANQLELARTQTAALAARDLAEKEELGIQGKKRKAGENNNESPEAKRRRLETEAEAAKRSALLQAASAKLAGSLSCRELDKLAKKRRRRDEVEVAVIASLLKGRPASEHDKIKQDRIVELRNMQAATDRAMEATNAERVAAGVAPFPPRVDLDTVEIGNHLAKIEKEEAKLKEDMNNSREFAAAERDRQNNYRKKMKKLMRSLAATGNPTEAIDTEQAKRRKRDHEAWIAGDLAKRKKYDDQIAAVRRENAAKHAATAAAESAAAAQKLAMPPDGAGGLSGLGGARKRGGKGTDGSKKKEKAAGRPETQAEKDLRLAIEQSLKDAEALAEAEAQEAMRNSLTYESRKNEHRTAMEARARIAGLTPEQYTGNAGYKSVNDYLEFIMLPAATQPPVDPTRSAQEEVLIQSQYALRNALRSGILARAKRENKTVIDILQERGGTNLNDWITGQVDSLTITNMPDVVQIPPLPAPLGPSATEAQKTDYKAKSTRRSGLISFYVQRNKALWSQTCKRIEDAGEWESVIATMPDPSNPPVGVVGADGRRSLEF